MKLETFFNKFDQFADAPDAVAKMRELVLHLAVQGRLVSNSTGNPLSAEQIASEKQRRLQELNIRSHPETPQPTVNDFPFSLPESWHAVALGDLAFSCPTSYGEDPIPSLPKAGVVKVGNIDNKGGFKGHFADRGFLPDEIESLLARRGDLMVVKSSGSAENVHSGKTALCTAEHDGKIVGTNFVLRLRLLGSPALPEYVWRVLTSRYSRAWIEGTVQTMTYPNLKWSDFARLPIPLPPLVEQKRIVAKVDELMALCDRLDAQQQEREPRHAALARASLARFADAPTPANLPFLFHPSYAIPPSDLRKSILTLAVQGKLVPQDPNEDPAETSIERVRKDAKKAIRDGIIRRHGLEETPDDGDLSELPFGWRWTRLVETTRPVQYAIKRGPFGSAIRKDMFLPTGFKVFEQQHAISGDFTKGRYYINEAKFKELSAFVLHPGEILVSCSGTVGKVAIVPADIERGIINQALLKLSLHQLALLNEYFLILFPAFFMETDTLTNLSGTAQKNIPGMDVLKAMPFPLPPLAEQRRIVAKVSELMALVDSLEAQLATSRAAGERLLAALVAQLTSHKE